MDFVQIAGENHAGGGATHLREVGRYCGEAAKDKLVHVKLVVGNDKDVLSYDKVLLVYLSREAYKSGVQLGVQDQEGVSRGDVVRNVVHELNRDEVVRCKA